MNLDFLGNTKILWVLVIILTVATIMQASQLTSIDKQLRKAEGLFGDVITTQNQFSNDIGEGKDSNEMQEIKIETVKEDISLLWYGSIPKESLAKIIEWYDNHKEFQNVCGEFMEDVSVSSGFYGYPGEMADTLRITYRDMGIQTMNAQGNIACYKYPIKTMTPPAIDCNDLCLGEEFEEDLEWIKAENPNEEEEVQQ